MKQKDPIRISLIGDIFPGELPFTQNYGIRTQFEKHKGKPWVSKIKEIIGINDIVVGNLESPLVAKKNSKKKTFCGNPEFGYFLKECGINVLNIANNHIMEQGVTGFQSTIQALGKAGIAILGDAIDSRSKIIYRDIKGLKIAIAGFSNVDLHVIQNDSHFAVLNEENVINTLKDMAEQNADLKMLSFHWGNEYVNLPSLDQRKMAYKFIDIGANIIIGHHPHVVQPYEKYKDGHIFYSLGNFIFDYIHSKIFSIGLVATLEVTDNKHINVNLNGIKLSYKNTVSSLPSHSFKKYYLKVVKLYDVFTCLTEEEYKKNYHTLVNRNRLQQRVLMKSSIIRELFRINGKDKICFIKNIFNYYFNRK